MKRWMAGLTPQAYPEGGAGGSGGTGDDKAAAEAAAAATAAAAAEAAKTPEAIAAEQKVKDDAAAAATAAGTKTPEQIAADKKTADDAAAAAAATNKAPDKYALKLSDTAKNVLDEADLKYVEGIARASGWSNDDAQAAVDEHVQTMAAQSARFQAEAKADKDYGGDRFDETAQLARAVIDRIRPKDHPRHEAFNRFLNRGGAGNHIEVLAFLADLGRQMREDGGARGGAGGGAPAKKSTADVLFGETAAKT